MYIDSEKGISSKSVARESNVNNFHDRPTLFVQISLLACATMIPRSLRNKEFR